MLSTHTSNDCNRFTIIAIFLFVFAACSDSGDDAPAQPSYQQGDYVAAGAQTTVTSSDINTALSGTGELLNVVAAYDVGYFKLTYKTVDADGNLTTASGIVAFPQKNNNAASPLLSLQHGTIYLDSQAPSNESLLPLVLYKTSIQAIIAASTGYLVVAPDYLGYGDSTVAVHPHMHADTLASTVVDLILASQRYFATRNIAHNAQVFLAGYSEGGYATLAAHKKLQEEYRNVITVSASAPGAGAYHVSRTAIAFANSAQLTAPDNVAFVMKSYNTVYNLNRLDDFFDPAHADFIDSAFYGDTSRETIAMALPTAPADLFNATFLTAFTGEGELELKALFEQNNIYDWQPEAPTYFFHGRDDSVVPYFNMTSAFDAMGDNQQVSFTDCATTPSEHGNCFLPYLQFVIDTFAGIADDL